MHMTQQQFNTDKLRAQHSVMSMGSLYS